MVENNDKRASGMEVFGKLRVRLDDMLGKSEWFTAPGSTFCFVVGCLTENPWLASIGGVAASCFIIDSMKRFERRQESEQTVTQ